MKLSSLLIATILGSPALRAVTQAMRAEGLRFDLEDAAAYLMAYYHVLRASQHVRVVYSPTRDLAC